MLLLHNNLLRLLLHVDHSWLLLLLLLYMRLVDSVDALGLRRLIHLQEKWFESPKN